MVFLISLISVFVSFLILYPPEILNGLSLSIQWAMRWLALLSLISSVYPCRCHFLQNGHQALTWFSLIGKHFKTGKLLMSFSPIFFRKKRISVYQPKVN